MPITPKSPAEPAGHSLRKAIRLATDELRRAGVSSPRHDAERLAAHALGTDWSAMWLRMDREEAPRTLTSLVSRRAGGEPLAYIEGKTVFCGLEIACGPGALVPRPETETLVEVALELIEGTESPVVLEIGTGTGAVAVAIAVRRPEAVVYATDTSVAALAYARRNVDAHGLRVEIARGDLFEPLPAVVAGSVDLVVSNPPYVPDGARLPPDVEAEPPEALFAGPRGDEVLQRLSAEAPNWLKPGGALALEIGEAGQAAALPGSRIRADMGGRDRVVWRRW